jgi:hypothetical protein
MMHMIEPRHTARCFPSLRSSATGFLGAYTPAAG